MSDYDEYGSDWSRSNSTDYYEEYGPHDDYSYSDRRDSFDKLCEYIYEQPPDSRSTPTDRRYVQHRPVEKTLLDSYMSDSDDSYTEEELFNYAKKGGYFSNELVERAENGDLDAYFTIGNRYNDDRISRHKSIKWYQRAAEKNHIEAQIALGDYYAGSEKTDSGWSPFYYNAVNTPTPKKNPEKALEWYLKAYENGNKEAACKMAEVYQNDLKQYESAMEWYIKAYDGGVTKAGGKIGALYQSGQGVPQNYDLAMEWYLKSYENGYTGSARFIGSMYLDTKWEGSDNNKALEWYQKAYADGSGEVAYEIAKLYDRHTRGPFPDRLECLKWYYKAALTGHSNARERISELKSTEHKLSQTTKMDIVYEHYTNKLKNDHKNKVKSLEEQLRDKDDAIIALKKKLQDAGIEE